MAIPNVLISTHSKIGSFFERLGWQILLQEMILVMMLEKLWHALFVLTIFSSLRPEREKLLCFRAVWF